MKKLPPILLGLSIAFAGNSQVAGPSSANASNTSSVPGSAATWSYTELASASDDKYAVFGNIPGNAGSYTDYLVLTDFGFSIPSTALVTGIVVSIERSDANGRTADHSIRIVKAGIIGATERSTGINYPLSDAIQTYGAAEDLWGEIWSYKDISNANFGVAIAAQRNSNGGTTAGGIDNVTITVYYRFGTLPLLLNDFSAMKMQRAVSVSWKVAEETDINRYVLERSADGYNFNAIKNITARNLPLASYACADSSPLAGNSYYRLRIVENAGNTLFSKVVKVNFNRGDLFQLFPSPVRNGEELFINNPLKEDLKVQFFTATGQRIGETETKNEIIKMPFPSERTGTIFYRILNMSEQLKGSGTLVIN